MLRWRQSDQNWTTHFLPERTPLKVLRCVQNLILLFVPVPTDMGSAVPNCALLRCTYWKRQRFLVFEPPLLPLLFFFLNVELQTDAKDRKDDVLIRHKPNAHLTTLSLENVLLQLGTPILTLANMLKTFAPLTLRH